MTTNQRTPAPLRTGLQSAQQRRLSRYLPFLDWLRHYRREDLVGDAMAGLIVAIMLVPQGMAYAMLAGLPPQVGLYASILPLFIYGLLGTSRTLAVGPVAIVSLLVASGLTPLAEPGSPAYVQLAITLALLVAVIQLGMGVVKLGFLVNFLSHPVLTGFTSAAAIVIGFSQMKHLVGVQIGRSDSFFGQVQRVAEHLGGTNLITLAIGVGSIGTLLYFRQGFANHLRALGVREAIGVPLTKSGPLFVVLVSTLLVFLLDLSQNAGVKIVGHVPAGLPPLTLPTIDAALWSTLLPSALTIAFVGFMESISVAKSLASKRRQKVAANQELIALGAANFGATLTGAYPVTGGFSRSVVNFAAGANTGLASIITAALIGLTVLFLTPLFYYLPSAVLAAIVMVAVVNLIDIATITHIWRYSKADTFSMVITFASVLVLGVEEGILVGVVAATLLFVWRTSRPHIAVVGRLGATETYRCVLRHEVFTCPHLVAIRVDESLYFANTKYLEETILGMVAERPQVEHLVLVGSAINFIDASALETLDALINELRGGGVDCYLADIKEPVMDRLKAIGFIDHLGADHCFLSLHDAMVALNCIGE